MKLLLGLIEPGQSYTRYIYLDADQDFVEKVIGWMDQCSKLGALELAFNDEYGLPLPHWNGVSSLRDEVTGKGLRQVMYQGESYCLRLAAGSEVPLQRRVYETNGRLIVGPDFFCFEYEENFLPMRTAEIGRELLLVKV